MIYFGKNVVKEMVLNRFPIFNVYLDEKFLDQKFLEFLNQNNSKIERVSKERLFKLTNTKDHQGIAVNASEFKYFELAELLTKDIKKIIILDSIQDPHNLGALLRSAEAFGIDTVVISSREQVKVTPTVLKVSAGAAIKVQISMVKSISKAIETLKENNFKVYSTTLNTNKSVSCLKAEDKIAVILGNEGLGVRKNLISLSDETVTIPMIGKINSLNVSVAGAIVMNEMTRKD